MLDAPGDRHDAAAVVPGGTGIPGPGRRARRRDGARPWHAADVPLAFGSLDVPGAEFFFRGAPDDHDRALWSRMLRAWVDFAADGEPGWPAVAPGATPVKCWAVPADRLTG